MADEAVSTQNAGEELSPWKSADPVAEGEEVPTMNKTLAEEEHRSAEVCEAAAEQLEGQGREEPTEHDDAESQPDGMEKEAAEREEGEEEMNPAAEQEETEGDRMAATEEGLEPAGEGEEEEFRLTDEQSDLSEDTGTAIGQSSRLAVETDTEEVGTDEVGSEEAGSEKIMEEEYTEEMGREDDIEEGSPKHGQSKTSLISAHAVKDDKEEVPEPEEGEKSEYDRKALLEKYSAAEAHRAAIVKENLELQNTLAIYFRKKKSDEQTEMPKITSDQEHNYLYLMEQMINLGQQMREEKENYSSQCEEYQGQCEDIRLQVELNQTAFTELKKQVAQNSAYSRTGRTIPQSEVEQYLATDNKKEAEVTSMRLENIKLKYKIMKKEQILKSKEELGTGLHLIDFEQLKIENQSLNEKIEERNEELSKLRRKISKGVQMLTHLKEKLQFLKGKNSIQMGKLQAVELRVSQKRDILSHTKQARDSLRIDNQRFREKSGLLGSKTILRDFENQRSLLAELRAKVSQLQTQYTELTLSCKQLRRKIKWARTD